MAELKFDREEFLQLGALVRRTGRQRFKTVGRPPRASPGAPDLPSSKPTPTIGGASDLFRAQSIGRFARAHAARLMAGNQVR